MLDTTTARQILEAHYQTSFEVNSTKHSRQKGVNIAYCQLKKNPEVKFYATFRPSDNSLMLCSYIRELWSFELKEKIDKKLAEKINKFIINVNIYTDLAGEANPTDLPGFDEMVNQVDDLEVATIIYLFKEMTQEDLQLIKELIEYVKTLNPQKSHFEYTLYDEDFFKDKDINSYTYGFKKLKKGLFEMDYKDYLRKRLIFSLKASSSIPTLEQLEAAIDEKPSVYGTKPTYF